MLDNRVFNVLYVLCLNQPQPKGEQSMDAPNKVNKALEIAKDINSEVQALVNKLFEKSEATAELKAKDPDMYFMLSNRIFSAMVAASAQRMLTDGLNRRRVGSKTYEGANLAWELFLINNPEVVAKIEAEKAAKAAKYASQSVVHDEGEEPEDEDEADDE